MEDLQRQAARYIFMLCLLPTLGRADHPVCVGTNLVTIITWQLCYCNFLRWNETERRMLMGKLLPFHYNHWLPSIWLHQHSFNHQVYREKLFIAIFLLILCDCMHSCMHAYMHVCVGMCTHVALCDRKWSDNMK